MLKLLATALTGPELARELMISLNTKRMYTKNSFPKLGKIGQNGREPRRSTQFVMSQFAASDY
ncbi:MAG: hypothetical protein IPM76_18310 [Chloroflexi bacterium]|nr:hypothetical protein [Chloroflexota bacterium]